MFLYGFTIVASAFLLFLVQPIVAKQVLPWFGGSAAVWTTCVLFFQALLLAGYGYAHALTRRRWIVQARVHTALLAASVVGLPIVASERWKPIADADPTVRIVGLLFATVGLPYFLASATGPLVQRWFSVDRSQAGRTATVYRLFALSNAGSLVGLLAYPFAVEPYTTSRTQAWGWSVAYVAFAIACAACVWRLGRRIGASDPDARPAVGTAPSLARQAYWIACGALASTLLLAVTTHITQNVASIPFLWILPLSLYLLSFVVAFEGRGGTGWYRRRGWLAPTLAATIAMTWALGAHRGVLHVYAAIPIFAIGLFVACTFCHGEVARTKPAPEHLTRFYLALSGGGVIGGLFVAVVAPRCFDNDWELPLALVALVVLASGALVDGRRVDQAFGAALGLVVAIVVFVAAGDSPFDGARAVLPAGSSVAWTCAGIALAALAFGFATWRRVPATIVVAALVATGWYAWSYCRFLSDDTLVAARNFYGTIRVKETSPGPWQERRLLHGVILHGDQLTAPDKRRRPTSYYGPSSGIAVALTKLRPDGTPLDVAMIGLGAGTLTAWGKPGDRYRIYELDPKVVDVAHREFTYLADTEAAVSIVLGDARLSMEREIAADDRTRFDVIAVDAFSSDAIPVHLMTREALAVFARRLAPDGIVAFHVSNRYLELAPVVRRLADDAGMTAIDIVDAPTDPRLAESEWVLVTRNAAFAHRDDIAARATPIAKRPDLPLWTDRSNDLWRILK